MRLPNGFGSVIKLSGKRRKPYLVRKTVGWHYDAGKDKQVQDYVIIGYAKTKAEGIQMLSDYNMHPYDVDKRNMLFKDVYKKFIKYRFGESRSSTKNSYQAAYMNCSSIHGRVFSELRRADMQHVIDTCDLSRASKELIRVLLSQMSKFAISEEICDKNYAGLLKVEGESSERGYPFSEDAIKAIWAKQSDETARIILMLIYSGIRIAELNIVEINIAEKTISGGNKSKASKERCAPIHDATVEFWASFDQASFNPDRFREKSFYPFLHEIGIDYENNKKHTPHDCRHTFSWLADHYGVDEVCKHLIMGHMLKGDVEQTVYRHRTLEELREAVNSIPIPT